MSSKPSVLDPIRVRIRRFQFVVGLGFMAQVIGAVLSVSLAYRLTQRMQDLPDALRLLIGVPMQNLWALLVLPLLCYGAARIIDLKPLSTAVGSVAAGQVFIMTLNFAWGGIDGVFPGLAIGALQVSVLAAGMLLSYRAILKGRAAAAQGAAKAQAQADARKVEYQEFLREAERGAEKTAQREAERAAAAGGTSVTAAPALEPASPSAASTEASGESKPLKAD